MELQEQIDYAVMRWQLAAFTGHTQDAKKWNETYMQLVLKKVQQNDQ